jgi:replicative DNA helicase
MLLDRTVVERVTERCGPDTFQVPEYREIFSALLAHGGEAGVEELAQAMSEDGVRAMQDLLAEPEAIQNLQRTVDDSLASLDERRLKQRNTDITRLLAAATGAEKDQLLAEKMANSREIGLLRAAREQA